MKKKMNDTTFRRLWCSILAALLILALVANTAAYLFRHSLDTYLGRGERQVTESDLSAEDAKFYDARYSDTSAETGSVSEGLAVAKAITG